MSDQPRAYVAGPLFDEGERFWIEKVEQLVAAAGFVTFLPHRDNPPKDQFKPMHAFDLDKLSGNRIIVRRARAEENDPDTGRG